MTTDDRIQMHSRRAMQELDWALRAGNERAARAHFDLSALHLDCLRSLQSSLPIPLVQAHGH